MTEISPDLYWIRSPISLADIRLTHVNNYLISDGHGFLLVDTGWDTEDAFSTLTGYMKNIGADIRDISRIVVTHVHPDHYGMAGHIKEISGAEILMHDIEKQAINPRYIEMTRLLAQTDRMLIESGVPHDLMEKLRDATLNLVDFITPVYPDTTIDRGAEVTVGKHRFQVLWTPGHASGHICLYEPERKILLSGDHILPTITPNISVNPLSLPNPLGSYLESLSEVRKLAIDLTLPGHDRPFRYVHRRIDAIIAHHEERNREILAAMGEHQETPYHIAVRIPWGNKARFDDLPYFHQRMAVFETLAHLEMMVERGKVEKSTRDGIIYFGHK